MKKLKQVNWIKCKTSDKLIDTMLSKVHTYIWKYHFYFNNQHHKIADIDRTLKKHNDSKNKINCYFTNNTYYMVIFKEDSIEVVYYQEKNLNNPCVEGLNFLYKYRRGYCNSKRYIHNNELDNDIEIF